MGRYKVDIPDELWREARAQAIGKGQTISQLVEEAIASHVEVDKFIKEHDAKTGLQAPAREK